ncbi:MAG: glycosyltransferase family 2 protein [Candidatus Paceibacterota bacterium]
MTISVIIVNFKNPALLRLCLKSLKNALDPATKYEILVVDVESSASTVNMVREEFPQVRLLPFKQNIGYTKGVNEGLKAASGDYFLILNPDVVPLKNSIEKMLEYMEAHSDTGILGPRLLNFDGSPQPSCFRFYTPLTILYRRSFFGKLPFAGKTLNKFLMKDKDINKTTEADWIMGSALMTSAKAVKKVGFLDEDFFLYMSDVDWAKRFWKNEYKVVYYPESQMYHYHRRSSKGGILDLLLKKEARWHLKDALKYFSTK